jgi:predicted ABC-type ATPase
MLWSPLGISEFVNADVIAQGLSGFNAAAVAVQAGRIMLTRLKQLAADRASFAFETTLASRTFARWIATLRVAGYAFDVYFFWLPTADLAVERVALRVQAGGHSVPEDTIRRRYDRGLSNFFRVYLPLATSWRFYNASIGTGPVLMARGSESGNVEIMDQGTWQWLVQTYASTKS